MTDAAGNVPLSQLAAAASQAGADMTLIPMKACLYLLQDTKPEDLHTRLVYLFKEKYGDNLPVELLKFIGFQPHQIANARERNTSGDEMKQCLHCNGLHADDLSGKSVCEMYHDTQNVEYHPDCCGWETT